MNQLYFSVEVDDKGSIKFKEINKSLEDVGKTVDKAENAIDKLAEAYKTLRIKSVAEMDQLRTKIIDSYNLIADNTEKNSNDMVRAEIAKVTRIKALNEEQFGHQKTIEDKIADSYKTLHIRSAAEMDQLRAEITNSYNMIVANNEQGSQEIIRAEEAKNAQLKALNEEQFGHQVTLLERLKSHWLEVMGVVYLLKRVFDFTKEFVTLQMMQEQSERALKASMIANDRYSESFYQATINQAKALRNLTGINDEHIIRAQKMLMTYEKISNDMLPRATQAMVNLSALMGGDAHQAAITLGSAMDGMYEGLRRWGIVIEKSVWEQRGAIGVLEEVEKKVKGKMETLPQGAGKWRLLGNEIVETKENLGEFFTLIADKSGFIAILSESINTFSEVIDGLNDALKGDSLTKLIPLLTAITGAGAAGPVGAAGGYLIGKGLQGIFDPKELNESITEYESAMGFSLQKLISAFITGKGPLDEFQKEQFKNYFIELSKWVNILAPEYQEATAAIYEMLEAFKDPATAEYKKELRELYEEFKPIRQQLGETAEVTQAWNLRLNELKEKYKTPVFEQSLTRFKTEFGIILDHQKRFGEALLELNIIQPEKEEEAIEIDTKWTDMAANMADVGRDELSDFLTDFTFDFEDMARGIRRVWAGMIADMAKEKFITPML